MEFEIFIKDNAFLPISVDIKTGTTVVFINTDAIRHEIHCKGHANFPLLSVNAGDFAHYKFSLPGRYEISAHGIGDMKCVVEATEVDRENIPKRNYFPTSKEKKTMEGQCSGRNNPIVSESNVPTVEDSTSDHDDQLSSIHHQVEYKTKRVSKSGAYGRPFKPSLVQHSDSSDSDTWDSGEEGNMAQQRSRVKASTVKFNRAVSSSSHTKEASRNSHITTKESVAVANTTLGSSVHRADIHTSLPTVLPVIPAATPPRLPSRHAPPVAHAPSLRTKLVMIEDYAFSVATMDVVVGQWIEFRLAEDVPAHAEHEICGISAVKQLCFESPLLQQEECTSFTYCPAHAGEIAVSCKVYPEMSCAIVVHPQSARLDATPPVSPDRAAAAERRRDGNHAPRVAFQSTDSHQHSPSQSGTAAPPPPVQQPQSPISPTSPAYQDVGEAVLQFDANKVPSPHRGYRSESQSSFYDSDDIFSDFEPSTKLQQQFDDLADSHIAHNGRSVLNEDSSEKVEIYHTSSANMSPSVAFATTTTGLIRKNTPHVASHVITHVVSIEEFSFRPQQLVVRCGEWVRFRRPAALVSASLVCEGEFVASEVNWPVEGDYLSLDHCFTKAGVFEVRNVIYTFCKCEVLVVPATTPTTGNTMRKGGAAPKLHGSFSSTTTAPAKPIFHFPITEEEKQALKSMPQRMAAPLAMTTSTTVNVTTTTTVIRTSPSPTNFTTSAPSTSTTTSQLHTDSSDSDDTLLVQSTQDKQAKKKKGPTETTPLSKPVPLYGSFMNLSGGSGIQGPSSTPSHNTNANISMDSKDNSSGTLPHVTTDSSIEAYINKFVSNLHTLDEVSEESEGGDAGEPDAAALRRRKKNQKKKEKLKLKQKQKRQAEQEQQAAEEVTHEPMDVVQEGDTDNYFVDNYRLDVHTSLQVSTAFGTDPHVTAVAAERSPEAVIDRYLKNADVSRSRIHAQIDWGEEVEFDDDFDEKTSAMDVMTSGITTMGEDGNIKDVHLPVAGPETQQPLPKSSFVADEVILTLTEDVSAAPTITAGKKKKKRSKAKRLLTDDGTQQETNVACELEFDGKEKRSAADEEVTLSQPVELPATSVTLVPTSPGSAAVFVSDPPFLTPIPVSPSSLPRQASTPFQAEGDTADGTSKSANNAHNVETNAAVLSPESFVTPTKTPKPRKEKARGDKNSGALIPPAAAPGDAEGTTAGAVTSAGAATTIASIPADAAVLVQNNIPVTAPHFVESFPTADPAMSPADANNNNSSTNGSMSRSSQLLRSALRITPQQQQQQQQHQQPRRDSPAPTVLFAETSDIADSQNSFASTRLSCEEEKSVSAEGIANYSQREVPDAPNEPVEEEALLSACYAFEAQMEEFFLSRYDNVMEKYRRGKADRLPSGKEVGILYLEEQREVIVTRGKSAAHQPHDPVKVVNSVHTANNREPSTSKKAGRKRK